MLTLRSGGDRIRLSSGGSRLILDPCPWTCPVDRRERERYKIKLEVLSIIARYTFKTLEFTKLNFVMIFLY
jgi:hypothetical protein